LYTCVLLLYHPSQYTSMIYDIRSGLAMTGNIGMA
jgi:hypothetical protein